jgi:copper transport protein
VRVPHRIGMMARVMHAKRTTRARTILAALLLGLVGGLVGALVAASPANAHAELVATTPSRDSVVQQAPSQVVLTFSESITVVEGKVRVIAPDGSRADSGEPSVQDKSLLIPLRPDGPNGTYLVTFRVLSADSHPVAGAFTYSVVLFSTPPSDTGANATVSPAVTKAFPAVRWIGYAGLLLLVGATLVLAVLWPRRLSRRGPIRVLYAGAAAIAAATVLEIVLQVPYVAGGALTDISGADVKQVLSSQFGAAHLIRLGVLGAALLLLHPMLKGKGRGADRVLVAVLGAIGIATWPVSGHPSASPAPMVTVVSDMIHLAAMSIWLGGLVMLAVFLLPWANAVELGAIVPVWSRWATYTVAALLLTGVAQALVEIGTIDALFSTRYGWLVVAKVGLVALVIGIASLSRRLVGPIVVQSDGAARKLRGLIIGEVVLSLAAVAVASVLVQTTPARTSEASAGTATAQSALLTDKLFSLSVDLVPARTGINELHLYASAPDGQPAEVQEWRVKASLESEGIEAIDATVLEITPNHATGQISLPSAGSWTFIFTLRTTEIDQSTVTAHFTVRP